MIHAVTNRQQQPWWAMALAVCLLLEAGQAIAEEASTAGSGIPATRFLTGLDLDGQTQRLGDGEGYRALAVIFLGHECPVAREFIPELNRLATATYPQPTKLVGVLTDPGLSWSAAEKFRQEFGVTFPLVLDASGEIAATLQPTHVPQAIVLDAQGAIRYRGRIDDRYAALGKKRPQPTTHELADALTAVAGGAEVAVAETEVVGCPLPSPATSAAAETVTFQRHVAPVLYTNCVECHRPGAVAPFSLLTYEDASKRADFIATVTSQRLMPPWKAEIGHGRFLGERHLTDRQVDLLAAWAKAGAPRGDELDTPPQPKFASGWALGEPDLVLTAPDSYPVPADGEDVFQHFVVKIDIPEDRTVVGFEFRPGNPAVVHHAILMLDGMGAGRRKDAETPEPGYTTSGSIGIGPSGGILGVWTPGMTPRYFTGGAGLPVKQGMDLVVQLHLHPSGKPETDQSSVALYFADGPVTRRMSSAPLVVGSLLIDIPAGSDEFTVRNTVTLPAPVQLVSLLPHMHLVGKEMKITATLPDGEVRPLIWIKDWNFYWQDNYVYAEPVTLPAGTKLELYSRYDNSTANPQNPSNPPQRVLFGNESDDEMCFGIFQTIAERPQDERKLMMALMSSFMREWQSSDIAPDAREIIIEEAGKLFGGGGGNQGGDFLRGFLNGGGRGSRGGAKKRSGADEAGG